jgi:hypothetical protein
MSNKWFFCGISCLLWLAGCAGEVGTLPEETAVLPTPTFLATSTTNGVNTRLPPAVVTAVPTGDTVIGSTQDQEVLPDTASPIDPAAFGAGALIDVRMNGRVGILLDEYSAANRDRAADLLLTQPDQFWLDLVEKQVQFTYHRLHFRDFIYDGKGQLPLPPQPLWKITLVDSEPSRIAEQGHEYVVIAYQFSTTLLTDAISPGDAEPLLGEIGGVWEEPFVLPLDPNDLLQRTGNACLNEAGFPPNSYDSENVRDFYDFACTPESTGALGCHRNIVPSFSCLEMIDARVGRLETVVRFERLPWDDALANQVRMGTVTHLDVPDMRVVAADLNNFRIIYRYFDAESCALQENAVGAAGWRRLLQFDATVHNVGGKALQIGPVVAEDPLTNMFAYNACHDHFHFSNYGTFAFTSAGQAAGSKRAFCVESTSRLSNNETSPLTHEFNCSYQGIQAGWVDEYGAGLDVQWIDITDIEAVTGEATAVLSFISNSDQFLCEGTAVTDAQGNPIYEPTGLRSETGLPISRHQCQFPTNWEVNNIGNQTIKFTAQGSFVTEPCRDSTVGPMRNCGFTEMGDLMACTSGDLVQLNVTLPDGERPQIMRICEVSDLLGIGVACTYEDAIFQQTLVDAKTAVAFFCPLVRDASTTSGGFSIYTAPAFNLDAFTTLEVVPVE